MTSNRALWEVTPRGKAFGLLGWYIRWCLPNKDSSDLNNWHYVTDSWNDRVVYDTRNEAIIEAANNCQWNFTQFGELAELMVRTRTGKWSKDKRTYGNDPEGNG